ncbi:HNH endonuclease [Streptomyces mirabilis]|uniref:HNH endonuclease n=1 Tax=Streptomyces mirabilis TaxID=68239 RepID=UPI00369023FF
MQRQGVRQCSQCSRLPGQEARPESVVAAAPDPHARPALAPAKKTVITDRRLAPVNIKRKELVTRLLAGRCEACGHIDEVEVHHVSKLADLGRSGTRPLWEELMASRHRKTLVVCGGCHAGIHGKKPVPALTE